MERIVIGSSRMRWIIQLIGALAFVATGVLFLVLGTSRAIAWLLIVFFGGCALVFAWQVLDRRPRIIIDGNGVLDRTLKVGVITWGDIRGVFLKRSAGQPLICLDLVDPVKYTSKLSPLFRRMVHLNRKLGFTDLSLNLSGTGVDPDRVLELMNKELATRLRPPAV